MVQWLGSMFSSRKAQDQSLVGELRPYKPHGVAKKKKKKITQFYTWMKRDM